MYINTETLAYPLSERDIKALFPNTSFPKPFVAPEPYQPVLQSPQPTVPNPVLQFAREIAPAKEGDNWMQQFEVVDIYHDYTDDEGVFHSKAEQEAEATARDEADKKAAVKAQAEKLLQETDWSQMPDVDLTNKAEFTTYRADVRAIALNPPTAVTEWPTKPDEVWSTTE